MLLAQAGEATKVATDGASTLMAQWGVAGVLVIVLIVSAGLMIRWFMSALKEQRTELLASSKELKDAFVAALTDERKACDARHAAQLASHEKEMDTHYEMVKEWRKEIIAESRAMRDMVQLWVARMALAKATGTEGEEEERTGKKARNGGSS